MQQPGGTLDGNPEPAASDGHDSIDPASIGGSATGSGGGSADSDDNGSQSGERRGPGRPKGSRRKSAPLDLSDLKDIVLMAHMAIATAFSAPRLQLEDAEGEKLAGAVQKVLRHYDLPDVASETKDWLGLIMVAGTIYGTRFMAYQFDKNTPPAPDKPQAADNKVINLTTVGGINNPGPGL